MPKPRAPSFAQLCAIARRVINAEPRIGDSEWREGIKRTLVAQRLDYPLPHVISDAMDRVERARVKVRGPRPPPLPMSPEPTPEPDARGRELTHDEACAALALVFKRLQLPAIKPRAMPHATPDDERRAAWERRQAQRLQIIVEAIEEHAHASRELQRAGEAAAEREHARLRVEATGNARRRDGHEPARRDHER